MLSRHLFCLMVLASVLGGIMLGCATGGPRQPLARAKAQPSVVPDPTPTPPPAWTPAAPSSTPAPPMAAEAQTPPIVAPVPIAANGPPLAPPPTPPLAPTAPPPIIPAAASVETPPLAAPDPRAKVRELHAKAAQTYARLDSYIARLRRRENVGGTDKPEELMLIKFRKQPWSVYFKWLGDEGKGREVVYVKGKYDNKMHTLLAAGDVPFFPPGKRMSLDPDSAMVKARSRHGIAEAGIGHIIEEMGRRIAADDQAGRVAPPVRYLGAVKRLEYDAPLDAIQETIAPGQEFPHGGERTLYFDPASHLPVLIVSKVGDREVEYYCYDRLQFPVKLDDDDFNPDKLWAAPKR
ncbi:MAG: DUF1571 domain-containing protein [Gemmataceae bacterium]|nr:DUF1571 domain-containing protein [Gemmataceae bacterium]